MSVSSLSTCCDGPYQRHQTHLDRTAPGPHDEHHPERLTDHQTLVQRGGLRQSDKLKNQVTGETELSRVKVGISVQGDKQKEKETGPLHSYKKGKAT